MDDPNIVGFESSSSGSESDDEMTENFKGDVADVLENVVIKVEVIDDAVVQSITVDDNANEETIAVDKQNNIDSKQSKADIKGTNTSINKRSLTNKRISIIQNK